MKKLNCFILFSILAFSLPAFAGRVWVRDSLSIGNWSIQARDKSLFVGNKKAGTFFQMSPEGQLTPNPFAFGKSDLPLVLSLDGPEMSFYSRARVSFSEPFDEREKAQWEANGTFEAKSQYDQGTSLGGAHRSFSVGGSPHFLYGPTFRFTHDGSRFVVTTNLSDDTFLFGEKTMELPPVSEDPLLDEIEGLLANVTEAGEEVVREIVEIKVGLKVTETADSLDQLMTQFKSISEAGTFPLDREEFQAKQNDAETLLLQKIHPESNGVLVGNTGLVIRFDGRMLTLKAKNLIFRGLGQVKDIKQSLLLQ